MADFATYADFLTVDAFQWKAYEAGIKKDPPGVLLQELLDFNKGAYEHKIKLLQSDRDAIREVAALTADEELMSIANMTEITISLEKFRAADPKTTRIVLGWQMDYTPEESRQLGLKHEGAYDPRKTIYVGW